MMNQQDAQAAIRKHGGVCAAARALGCDHSTLSRAARGLSHSHGVTRQKAEPQAAPSKAGRSLTDFRQTYDKATIIPAKVKAALKALGTGWEYEVEFAKLAGVSLVDLGRFRDAFSDHVVSIGRDSKRAWAGTTATAKAMRDML